MRRVGTLTLAVTLLGAPACGGGLKSYSIVAGNMEPTLRRGDHVGCSRDVPDRVPRGRVVVYRRAEGAGRPHDYVSRVVGLPGERIEGADDGTVKIDGQPLVEPYADKHAALPFGPVTVPADAYFLLGDNRDGSADSRFMGPVPRAEVVGVCPRILRPRDRRGEIPGPL